jgi:hypothetical protein
VAINASDSFRANIFRWSSAEREHTKRFFFNLESHFRTFLEFCKWDGSPAMEETDVAYPNLETFVNSMQVWYLTGLDPFRSNHGEGLCDY